MSIYLRSIAAVAADTLSLTARALHAVAVEVDAAAEYVADWTWA